MAANFTWTTTKSELCYDDFLDNTKDFCGNRSICDAKGLLLPLFLEVAWPREARAVLYFIGLCYSFLGVSIVADVFMCAIEKITYKTKTIHMKSCFCLAEKYSDYLQVFMCLIYTMCSRAV